MRSCDGSWWRGGCFLDPLPLAGHDLVGLAHQLGHGQLARTVAAGLEPLDDPGGELDVAAVELGLGPSKGGDVLGPGVLAEEQLEQAEAAELGRLVGRLGQPFGERGPALGRDPVAAPPPPGLLALLGQEPEAGQPFGLGVDLPEHVQRLRWPADRLRQERRDRLRDLPQVAKASSPWHRDRLAGVDPDGFEEADLAGLPPMTKDDLMANWDRVVTDRRLTLELVEGHLAGVESDTYLFDELHAVASGGSTGRRGSSCSAGGPGPRPTPGSAGQPLGPGGRARAGRPAHAGGHGRARIATHMTSAMPQTFANPMVDVALFPVTQPIDRIVAGLNAYQPLALMGYPSMLALLAAEARAGRLRILPRRVTTTSEPLLPEVRQALTEAFCAPVANMYGTSEAGPIGVGCFRRPGIHLCDDLVIVEPVDLDGRPVPPGVRSDKLYVTALVNPTLPLIRFELTFPRRGSLGLQAGEETPLPPFVVAARH
jgi:phenylacetate-CoA ligase